MSPDILVSFATCSASNSAESAAGRRPLRPPAFAGLGGLGSVLFAGLGAVVFLAVRCFFGTELVVTSFCSLGFRLVFEGVLALTLGASNSSSTSASSACDSGSLSSLCASSSLVSSLRFRLRRLLLTTVRQTCQARGATFKSRRDAPETKCEACFLSRCDLRGSCELPTSAILCVRYA